MDAINWGNAYTSEAILDITTPPIEVLISGELGPEPAAHGVLLFSERLNGQTFLPSYQAEITLRAGIASTKFVCDWRGQFSVIAQQIEVRLLVVNPSVMEDDFWTQPTGLFKHGAAIGFGGWHAARPLTYTAKQQLLGGGSVLVPVPAFARRFFPQLLHYSGAGHHWDTTGVVAFQALDYANAARYRVTVYTGNANPVSSALLTREVIERGIDVQGASAVGLSVPGTVYAPLLVQPVFELGL
jgi:hypothetical protein